MEKVLFVGEELPMGGAPSLCISPHSETCSPIMGYDNNNAYGSEKKPIFKEEKMCFLQSGSHWIECWTLDSGFSSFT